MTDEVFWIEVVATDAVGAVASTVNDRPLDVFDSPPLVATAVIVWVPAESAAVVHDHAPVVVFAVHALPVFVFPVRSCTEDPPTAVPVKVSVVEEVMLSEFDAPLSFALARTGVDVCAIV